MQLDPDTCRRARLSRDPRFDGEFFLAVSTTGIYCRPVCPARPPAERNVRYFRLASQAAEAGYRPCLRCRPETAPGSPAWAGTTTTVQRALRLIDEGALDGSSVAALAQRLGVGERYLRKLFERELGISPRAVALNRRLLFAKQLLAETDLPVTEVAFAAGFGSVRRFNDALLAHFRLTPTQLRGRRGAKSTGASVRLVLNYRPPYDWDGVMAFFSHHVVDGVEEASAAGYRRHFLCDGRPARLEVTPLSGRDALQLVLSMPDHRHLQSVAGRVRRMFDLDANPRVIGDSLAESRELAPLLRASPGARSPGHWSLYEAAVRAVVGQQVSTAAARGICARLARRCSGDLEHPVFPPPAALLALDDNHFPMPGRRRDTLRQVCRLFGDTEQPPDATTLGGVHGIGPWTVAMVSIRGAGEPDVFPPGDLGLVRAWGACGGNPNTLTRDAAAWSPWRSYAANLLWRSLGA
jgi:AraC family transcriptional regulator of adaptative response / DNA-3-methyladenine glycosylase II